MRSEVNGIITGIYLISWVFFGNLVFLNLFLAILLDGFSSGNSKEEAERELLLREEDEELKQREKTTMDYRQVQMKAMVNMNLFDRAKTGDSGGSNSMVNDPTAKLIKIKSETKVTKYPYAKAGIRCKNAFFLFSKKNCLRQMCFWMS
jgi:hypothetical protein